MVKTYTTPSSSSKKNNGRKEPSRKVVSNIMAYARSLQVMKMPSGNTVFLLGN